LRAPLSAQLATLNRLNPSRLQLISAAATLRDHCSCGSACWFLGICGPVEYVTIRLE
jgi:hypothetical protein